MDPKPEEGTATRHRRSASAMPADTNRLGLAKSLDNRVLSDLGSHSVGRPDSSSWTDSSKYLDPSYDGPPDREYSGDKPCFPHPKPASVEPILFPSALLGLRSASVFQALVDELYGKEGVVYCTPPFGGPESVLAYLGRYTHRVAISNFRLLRIEGGPGDLHLERLCSRLPGEANVVACRRVHPAIPPPRAARRLCPDPRRVERPDSGALQAWPGCGDLLGAIHAGRSDQELADPEPRRQERPLPLSRPSRERVLSGQWRRR